MTSARRETLLLAAFSLWGIAIAIALIPMWHARGAVPGQLPGGMTQQNIDASATVRAVGSIVVLALALPIALRPIAHRIASAERWAFCSTIAAILVAVWFVSITREPLWVIVPCAIAIALFTLLRNRALDVTRRDWVLLPAFATTLLAIVDITKHLAVHKAVIVAAAIVAAVRIAVAFIPSPLPPGLAFFLAPLGLTMQTGFFARDQRYFGWHALLLVVVSPFIVRVLLRNGSGARVPRALAFIIYPLAVFAYMNATSLATAEGKPRVNFFEHGYTMPVASEYLRGERPYRDILPVHGLVADGLFDAAVMRTRGVTIGNALRARETAGAVNAIAIYALGAAMIGAAEGGVVTYFLWQLTGSSWSIRFTPAIFTLALIVTAIRKRDPRYLLAAGIGTVVCGITSLDFAAYTFVVLVFAALRMRAWKSAAIGIASALVVLLVIFAAFGILDDFIRGTFFEIPSMGAAYTLPLLGVTRTMEEVRTFPEVLSGVFRDPATYALFIWCAIAIATAVLLTRTRRRRYEPFVVVGLWIVLAAISFAERHHLYYMVLVPAMLIATAWIATRYRWLVVAFILMTAMLTAHVSVIGQVRRARGPFADNLIAIDGAYFHAKDAAQVAAARKYIDTTLKPNETFFDFTNRPMLFYLLRRDNPVRYVEVANYEHESRQREVIAALERNPHVRAALVPPGGDAVDGVPSYDRAPLVWQYLQAHFTPDFEEGEVVFWRRK